MKIFKNLSLTGTASIAFLLCINIAKYFLFSISNHFMLHSPDKSIQES
ncbi:hypothetical protein [Elizabethkingia meningoseptica]